MKETRILMGMPVTVEIADTSVTVEVLEKVFAYFCHIDNKFSIYKKDSEISRINRNEISKKEWSQEMKTVFKLAEQTRQETGGYFNIFHQGKYDPSGLVKGWAILRAAWIIKKAGFKNYYVEAGGDVQTKGKNSRGQEWRVGIRNPFNLEQVVKVVNLSGQGIATSGTYLRGQHIYDPRGGKKELTDIVSLTVIGPDIYEADRFATAAFVMERDGIRFIEKLVGFEGYMIDSKGVATMTSGFEKYANN